MILAEIDLSIVTYNSEKWLTKFFDSLIQQSYPLNLINLYFTDNSSNDNTFELLEKFKREKGILFKSINLFVSPNFGFGCGHNNNIFKASSEFILVTNVDLEFDEMAIEIAVKYAVTDKDNVASWEFRQKPYEHPKYYNPITLETTWSSSACVLFRKKALEKVNGYEKKIFMYGEDVDISYRLRDAGYVLKYFPKAVVWHYTYEYEHQVKPLQFFGSTMANILLRVRFGSFKEILKGGILYLSLFFMPSSFENQKIETAKNLFKILYKIPYFFVTRKKSNCEFPFQEWDYEISRYGAFYKYDKRYDSNDLVSVVVRTYNNRNNILREAIQSIINQTHNNIDLIVVEDGSNYAKELVSSICADNITSIQYISIPKAGRCVAGNKGLEASKGRYCIFLDDDDAFYPEHIEVLLNSINKYNVKAVYSNAFEVRTHIESLSPLKYQELSKLVIYKQPFSRVLMWHNNYIPIQCVLFSKELYNSYGGFDTDLENLEDWNLWTRYSLDNDFKYIEKTTSMYRVPHHTSISKERQDILDKYYTIALDKQINLKISINLKEFNILHKELSRQINILTISKDTIRNKLLEHSILYRFYNIARKVYYKCFRR